MIFEFGFFQCVNRDVGFFEAWVSVFDGGFNREEQKEEGLFLLFLRPDPVLSLSRAGGRTALK